MSDAELAREFVGRVLQCRLQQLVIVKKTYGRARKVLITVVVLAVAWITASTLRLLDEGTQAALDVLSQFLSRGVSCINVILAKCGPTMKLVLVDNGVFPLLQKLDSHTPVLRKQCAQAALKGKEAALSVQRFVSERVILADDLVLGRALADIKSLRELPIDSPKQLVFISTACSKAMQVMPRATNDVGAHLEKLKNVVDHAQEEWARLVAVRAERKRFAVQLNTWLLEQIPFRFTRGLTRQAPHLAVLWADELFLFSHEVAKVAASASAKKQMSRSTKNGRRLNVRATQ